MLSLYAVRNAFFKTAHWWKFKITPLLNATCSGKLLGNKRIAENKSGRALCGSGDLNRQGQRLGEKIRIDSFSFVSEIVVKRVRNKFAATKA